MSAVRSVPVSVSVQLAPLSPGVIRLLVITPSMSTLADPFTVATRMQRMNRSGRPPVRRKRIWSGDCLSIMKVSSKPLWPTSTMCTSTDARHSSTLDGTGVASTGPIINVSWTLSSNSASGNALRRGDVEHPAWGIHEVPGRQGTVGIADEPRHERITQVFGRDQIQAIVLLHGVLVDGGVVGRAGLGHNAPREIGNRSAV